MTSTAMAKFAYKIKDLDNHIISGVRFGDNADEITDFLEQKTFTVLAVDELNFDGSIKGETFGKKFRAGWEKMQNRIPLKSVVFFTRQLATMIQSGVPISEALVQLAEGEKPAFRKIILQIEEDIGEGKSFSEALSRHPGAFNNMFIAVIRSGEATGALVTVLDEMATYLESMEVLRQKIVGALRYPAFIGLFVTIMVTGILWKLVPVFASMYKSFDAVLPLPTRILVNVSDIFQHYFPLVLLSAVALIAGVRALYTHPRVRFFVHTHMLKIPIYGMIIQKNIWARFCRTLALLMESGTPILQAVEITSAVVNNSLFSFHLEAVYEKIRNGEQLSKSLRETGIYSRLVTQLTATGEKSGQIDKLLVKAAEFYEREIRITVDSLSSIIEPLLIILLGCVVGGIVISLYLPIFSLGKLIH
ncbi:MAG: type II secretion system F family protein [Chitinispirillaceae bacterium]|nr:type II secretion system F family protein [Chitinispirillaceae bacterium]